MILSGTEVAGISLVGHLCDAVGGLYLAFDVFRRHAGPLGVLTRAVTYSVVLAVPSAAALGLPFGAIAGTGLGLLISIDNWRLARRQRLMRSSPLTQSAWAGAERGVILGVALVPRYGWRFGLTSAAFCAAFAAVVYGMRLVPTFRSYPGGRLVPPAGTQRAALLRGLALGAGTAAAARLVGGASASGLGLEVAGLVAAVSLAVAVVAPQVELFIEQAGDSFFVYAGLSLLFGGLVCDSIPHVVELLR